MQEPTVQPVEGRPQFKRFFEADDEDAAHALLASVETVPRTKRTAFVATEMKPIAQHYRTYRIYQKALR